MRPSAIARLLFTLLVALCLPRTARAFCDTNLGECVFPQNCAYLNDNGTGYGLNYVLRYLWFENSNACAPFPGLGNSQNVGFDAIATRVELSSNGGATYNSYSVIGHFFVRESTVADNGTDKTVQTELLSLDLTGGSLPAGTRLRESPTLASIGQANSHAMGGGQFHIDSFFDVFTELSIDDGVQWMPSTGPVHITLSPSTPLPVKVETWGSLKAIYR